jgi:Transposase IS116/IS110/IS902 family
MRGSLGNFLPPKMVQMLAPFTLLFSKRVFKHAQVLLMGAILAPGRRTVSSALRAIGLDQEKRFHRYHRVLSRAPPGHSSLGEASVPTTAKGYEGQIAELEAHLERLVVQAAPELVSLPGTDNAATLLIVAGNNPRRLKSEASFANLCGISPIEASSGKVVRHRLNRGGNREANRALYMICLSRMRRDQRTQGYVARRTAEGKREEPRPLGTPALSGPTLTDVGAPHKRPLSLRAGRSALPPPFDSPATSSQLASSRRPVGFAPPLHSGFAFIAAPRRQHPTYAPLPLSTQCVSLNCSICCNFLCHLRRNGVKPKFGLPHRTVADYQRVHF